MKGSLWFNTAEKCGAVALLFSLAFASPGFSQIYKVPTPVIGPFAAPLVRIIAPANHAQFISPVDIPIYAYARDLGVEQGFTNVEFYAGTNDLGPGRRLAVYPPIYGFPPVSMPEVGYGTLLVNQPEYTLVWTNPAPGSYVLTAVARRALIEEPGFSGISVTSAPVNITVLPPVTPPTNTFDIVSIVATDPVAIEGTNCWVTLGTTNATPAWATWPPVIWNRITNCGPKSAVFTVRRFGDASKSIDVHYTIGGTASNGVNYVGISNVVTIPAGEAYAQVDIVPVDEATSNILTKTVILSLVYNPTTPAATYFVGVPARAEAIIFDGMPRPSPIILPDLSFHLNAPGPDGAWFVVEYTSDLVNWTPVCTNQVVQGSIDFADPDAANNSSRFYRAVPQ